MSTGELWATADGERFVEAGLEWDDEHGLMTRFIGLNTYPNITLLRVNAQGMTERGLAPVNGIKAGKHGVESLWRALWPKAGDE